MNLKTMPHEQLATMLGLQATINSRIDPNWLEVRNPFLRGAVFEGAEAGDHIGWKWWKKQKPDMPQAQMELIDIWHFMLSQTLLHTDGDIELAAAEMSGIAHSITPEDTLRFDNEVYHIRDLDTVRKVELLVGLSVSRRYNLSLFSALMKDVGLSADMLFTQYLGKNVLNLFRQDHGYQEGTYIKHWSDGREDNEHLSEILHDIDIQAKDSDRQLYQQLAHRYAAAETWAQPS